MKEMNETQLRSWRPRRPSAGLKRRILRFAGEADVPTARWLWGCVAPTMACALLTLMAFNRAGDGLGQRPAIALILSSQSRAAYATGGAQAEQNHLAAVTFDSTNRSVLGSSIRFMPTTNFSN
jgi:hypothetical protein